jgi:acetyl-CoA carboxylase carboxyltransferase component
MTKVPACGVLRHLDASLVVKVGDFVNVSADLSAFKMSHAGKGFVTGKETKDGVSTFIVKYLETEAGRTNQYESGIPVSRLTVTPFAIFGDRPKLQREIR